MTGGGRRQAATSGRAAVVVVALSMVLVGLRAHDLPARDRGAACRGVPSRPGSRAGSLNTSRQVGAALAVIVFGGLLARPDAFVQGMLEASAWPSPV